MVLIWLAAWNSDHCGQGPSPGWGQCVVILGSKLTLYSHSAGLSPARCIPVNRLRFNAGWKWGGGEGGLTQVTDHTLPIQ